MTIFSDKFEKGKLMVQNEWSLKVQCSDTKHIINVVFLRVSDIFSAPISDTEYRNHQGPFFISTMPPA